jgi:hypothetical protein
MEVRAARPIMSDEEDAEEQTIAARDDVVINPN